MRRACAVALAGLLAGCAAAGGPKHFSLTGAQVSGAVDPVRCPAGGDGVANETVVCGIEYSPGRCTPTAEPDEAICEWSWRSGRKGAWKHERATFHKPGGVGEWELMPNGAPPPYF